MVRIRLELGCVACVFCTLSEGTRVTLYGKELGNVLALRKSSQRVTRVCVSKCLQPLLATPHSSAMREGEAEGGPNSNVFLHTYTFSFSAFMLCVILST